MTADAIEEAGVDPSVVIAPPPERPIERGLAGPRLLAPQGCLATTGRLTQSFNKSRFVVFESQTTFFEEPRDIPMTEELPG